MSDCNEVKTNSDEESKKKKFQHVFGEHHSESALGQR